MAVFANSMNDNSILRASGSCYLCNLYQDALQCTLLVLFKDCWGFFQGGRLQLKFFVCDLVIITLRLMMTPHILFLAYILMTQIV